MSIDEARAIFLYTADSPFFKILNDTLRKADREPLKDFFPYLRILLNAFARLPATKGSVTLNRGVKMALVEDFPFEYFEGGQLVWYAVTSLTDNVGVLKDFLGTSGKRTIIQITTKNALNIKDFSSIPGENELVLPPGSALVVKAILDCGNGLTMLQCEDDPNAPSLVTGWQRSARPLPIGSGGGGGGGAQQAVLLIADVLREKVELDEQEAAPLLKFCKSLGVKKESHLKTIREEHVEELINLAPTFVAKETLRALLIEIRGPADGGGGGGGGASANSKAAAAAPAVAPAPSGGGGAAAAAEDTEVMALLSQADAAYDADDYVKAAELYAKVCAQNPTYSARAWFRRGYCLDEGPNASDPAVVDEGIKCYRKAIELDPKDAYAHNNLALLLENHKKDFKGAEQCYRKAIELDPKYAMAHNNLGALLQIHKNDFKGAEQCYRKAIELDPKYANAHNNLGALLKDRADAEEKKSGGGDPMVVAALLEEAAEHWEVKYGAEASFVVAAREKARRLRA